MELKSLTTSDAARLCCVSSATIKRWERDGILKSERTSGGHRRFRAEEIARLRRAQESGTAATNGATNDSAFSSAMRRRASKGAADGALVAGCESEAANIVISAHLGGATLTEIFDRLVCPAMRRVGELWYNGDLSITEEHAATQTALSAIRRLRATLPIVEPTGETAMCCAIEGDFHELPTHLVQMTIEAEGWETINFGANTPLYSLAEEAARHKPEMICIAATVINDVERLTRDYKTFAGQTSDLEIPVVLGGRAFADECVRQRFPADYYAHSFAEVAALAKQFENDK